MNDVSKQIRFVNECSDEKQLSMFITNAKAAGAKELESVAFRKLISLVPAEKP